jgi:hypothetical protein
MYLLQRSEMKANKHQTLFLQLLKSSNPRGRKVLLSGAENAIVKLLSEIIYNLLHGNVPLNSYKIQRLRRHKQTLHTLSDRTVSLDRKRNILQQHGSGTFFPLLFPIISSLLGVSS